MFEELFPIINVCEDWFYIRLWEFTYDLEMNKWKYSIISNDLDHIPVQLYWIEFGTWINFYDIRIKSLYSMNKLNWNATLWKISDLIYEYENYEEEVEENNKVVEVQEEVSDVVLTKENYISWIRYYSSTELTRLWVNYNTLQWDKYVKVFGNKYIVVKDIVDKFLFDNWIENGNKEKE